MDAADLHRICKLNIVKHHPIVPVGHLPDLQSCPQLSVVHGVCGAASQEASRAQKIAGSRQLAGGGEVGLTVESVPEGRDEASWMEQGALVVGSGADANGL